MTAPAWREASVRVPPLYAALGLEPSATEREIQVQYKKLALQFHPDRLAQQSATVASVQDPKERFQEIQKAYALLGDAKARAEYDAKFGLNLHRRVGALMTGLKTKPSGATGAAATGIGSAFVPLPAGGVILTAGPGEDTTKRDGAEDDEEDDYVPGGSSTSAAVAAGSTSDKAQMQQPQQHVVVQQIEVDDEWAALLGS